MVLLLTSLVRAEGDESDLDFEIPWLCWKMIAQYPISPINIPILPILSGPFAGKSYWPLLLWNQTVQLNYNVTLQELTLDVSVLSSMYLLVISTYLVGHGSMSDILYHVEEMTASHGSATMVK